MKIFIAADHGGFELKNQLLEYLKQEYDITDLGPEHLDADDDYPIKAYAAATRVLGEEIDARAILVCRSGQGMAMAANRVNGIRAAVVWNKDVARETREANDSNIMSLAADYTPIDEAKDIVDIWLLTKFSGEERHVRRIKELEDL